MIGDAGRRSRSRRKPLPTLPATPDQAVDVALGNNADLASIAAQARAAGYDVRVAQRRPAADHLSGEQHPLFQLARPRRRGRRTWPRALCPIRAPRRGIGLSLRLPLYQGGAGGARVRQAQRVRGQLLEQAVGVERAVVSDDPRRLRHLSRLPTTRSSPTRSRSPPTSSRSKARAPSRRSARATCSTC